MNINDYGDAESLEVRLLGDNPGQGAHMVGFDDGSGTKKSVHMKLTELQETLGNVVSQIGNGGGGGTIPSNVIFFEEFVVGETVEIDTTPITDTTAPVLTITSGGTFTGTKTILMNTNETATIYYTLNGGTPTTSSTVYSGALSISATTTLRAFARDTAGNNSSVQVITYTLDNTQPVDTTAPNDVTNLSTSNVTQTGLTLNWTASTSSDIASYDVYNGTTLLGNTANTSYNVTGLTAGTQYTFNVKAKDGSGNASVGVGVTVTTTASTPSAAYVTQNLVAGYDMSKGTGTSCSDLSGNNNNLTLVGTDGTTGGFVGGVLLLDGQNDAVEILDSPSFAFGTNDFSIQMKFKLNVAQTTQILFSQSGADSGADANTSVTCYMSGDTITFRSVVNSTRYQFATTTTLTDTASYHNIEMVRRGDTLYGYLDEVQVGSITLPVGGTVNNSTKKFAIGKWGEDPSLFMSGMVRAFLVYNGKALTTTEMAQNSTAFAV